MKVQIIDYNVGSDDYETHYVEITEDMYRFWEWLKDNAMIFESVELHQINDFEYEKI